MRPWISRNLGIGKANCVVCQDTNSGMAAYERSATPTFSLPVSYSERQQFVLREELKVLLFCCTAGFRSDALPNCLLVDLADEFRARVCLRSVLCSCVSKTGEDKQSCNGS